MITSWDWLSTDVWDWLRAQTDDVESGSTTIRNLGLVFAGAVALLLAIWRSWVSQRQADTAQQHLLNERYQRGGEMLGSNILSVRLGGIYALQRLAKEHPEQYHIQIMQLLCAFVRHPTNGDGVETQPDNEEEPRLREDIQAAIEAISSCHSRQIDLEKEAKFLLDLRGAHLAGVLLVRANLVNANLHYANLAKAQLLSADLSGARLVHTNLSCAQLPEADLTCAYLVKANLSGPDLHNALLANACLNNAVLSRATLVGSDLSGATLFQAKLSGATLSHENASPETRLTQSQLNQARADPDNPPFLDGAVDAETGKPLVWRDKRLEGQT